MVGAVSPPSSAPIPTDLPLVGRSRELGSLHTGLAEARGGRGSAWTLVGPGGIGKTRILRALEKEARAQKMDVRWGYCLKECLAPFFPFEQIFRAGAAPARAASPEPITASTVLFEEERPREILVQASALAARGRPLLLLSRERPAALRQRLPDLPSTAVLLWLSRTEGPEAVAPGALDALGERLEAYFRDHRGAVVALSGLEYLISQNSFLPVLRLLQVLRDSAEAHEGTFLLSVNSATLENRERSLLEAEGDVIREAPAGGAPLPETAEPPALRLLRYLEALKREAQGSPQLVVLDDLQWADAQSRAAFQFLVRNSRDQPVLFVAALRDESDEMRAVPGEDSLQEMLDHLEREGLLHTLRLKGLEPGAARDLVRNLVGAPLGQDAHDAALLDLLERTNGNPYFLVESLQQLVEQGTLRREGDRAVLASRAAGPSERALGAPATVPLPPTIRRLVGRRLEAVSPEELKLLTAASVVGSEFDLAPLASVLGLAAGRVEDMVRELSTRQRLVQPGGRPGTWEFAHPLVWEVLSDSRPKAQERQLALELARWWERERAHDPEAVTRLYYLARDREGFLRWVTRAVDPALGAQATDTLLRYIRWRQEMLTDSPDDQQSRAIFEAPLIISLDRHGAGPAARLLAKELHALPLSPPGSWEATLALARVTMAMNAPEARRWLEALDGELKAAADAVPADLQARLLHALMVLGIDSGRWEQALVEWARFSAVPSADVGADIRLQGHLGRAWCLQALGRLPEAMAAMADAKAVLGEGLPAESRARFYNTEGVVRFSVDELQGARESFAAATAAAHDGGNVNLEVLYRGNLSNLQVMLGEYDGARREAQEARALAEKFQYERGITQTLRNEAQVCLELGQWDEAEAALRRARPWYAQAGNPLITLEIDRDLAILLGRRGDAAAAVRALTDLEAHAQRFAMGELPLFYAERSHFRLALGDGAGARADIEAAEAWAEKTGANALHRAQVLYQRSEVEARLGEAEASARHRKEAIALLRKQGLTRWHNRTLEELAAPPPP